MKRIEFQVSDILHQQIQQAMVRLGVASQSEFFRMLARESAKENPPEPERSAPSLTGLTREQKILLLYLQHGPKTADDLKWCLLPGGLI